jgi:PQQ-dependent catabolism-associated CXXCW motif protein
VTRRRLGAIAAVWLVASTVHAAPVPEPEGYRIENYRAPVPATLAGATVLDTGAARALWEAGETLFVDVLPSPPRPDNLPAGTIWQPPSRDTIPGAAWLPNVGFGALDAGTDAYFRDNLARLAGGDTGRAVVFFCRSDCWMSWNAARRAMTEYGYEQVLWYPSGTDGWEAAGLPLQKVRAEDMAR